MNFDFMMSIEDRKEYMRKWKLRNSDKVKSRIKRQYEKRGPEYKTTAETKKNLKLVWKNHQVNFGKYAYAPSRGTKNGVPIWA